MKPILTLNLLFLSMITSVSASIIDTKIIMNESYTDFSGVIKKLPRSTTHIVYDDNLDLINSKGNCVVEIGNSSIGNIIDSPITHNCLSSNGNYILVDDDTVEDMFLRPTHWMLSSKYFDTYFRFKHSQNAIKSKTDHSIMTLGLNMMTQLLKMISEDSKVLYKISLKDQSAFEISNGGVEKLEITLTPTKSKTTHP